MSIFTDMELNDILKRLQIDELNAMQKEVLDNFNPHNDFVLLSPTGSGKTLAFSLLVEQLLNPPTENLVQTIIVVPTRELALQIESVIKKVSRGHKVLCVYGGHDTKIERKSLRDAPSILIGTPGRIIYHLDRNHFATDNVETLVLDEFDKSLELGFQEQLKQIITTTNSVKRKILTSATDLAEFPDFITLKDPVYVKNIDSISDKPNISFKKVTAQAQHKLKALINLICNIGNKKILIFCNHRDAVNHVSELLDERDLIHDVFHGGLEQADRELSLLKFRNGSNQTLIATDLAARGLDIPEVDSIIHYQLPTTEDAFIHRNGRTARMHESGNVFLLLKPDDDFPYLNEDIQEFELKEDIDLPAPTPFTTLHIPVGKKDKVNKIDIVGYVLQIKGVEKDDLGLIEVKDKDAYIAVKRNVATLIIKSGSTGKIKGNKIKFFRT